MDRLSPKTSPPGNSVSRRGFLASLTVAAAGAAGPFILPGRVWAAEGEAAPSERLRLGFIGMGKQMGGLMTNFLHKPNTQVVAICDVEALRLERRRREIDEYYAGLSGRGSYAGCATYGDFRDLLARQDIDAVVIATPDHWHALVSIAAMRSGKDVYCEKPLSLTVNEGKAMLETARAYGRVFQTGSMQRSMREFRQACELVRNGAIGKVHTVYVNVGGPPTECYLEEQPVPVGLNWDMWLGPAPVRPYNADIAPDIDYKHWPNWRAYRDYSGGMMTDWGAHHFDIAQWGLGMDGSGPVEIIPPDGKDYTSLTYKYANGVVMHHNGGSPQAGAEFVGESGRVMVNRGYIATDPPELLNTFIGPDGVRLYDSQNHYEDWLDCIRTRQRPICDIAVGFSSICVCHTGNIAYWLKRPLKWDPAASRFVNDDAANRLLQRPMRDPWKL